MSETYVVQEVNLLRNVQRPESRSTVSKEFSGLKRNQRKEERKKGARREERLPLPGLKHGGYENESPQDGEQEGSIDITI